MPENGDQTSFHVRPKDVIQFSGLNLDNISIDILGPDIVITDLSTSSRLVFPGLGLILFSEDEAPQIIWDGKELSANELLSFVGRIQNITQKDYLSFTSFDLNPNQGAEEKMGAKQDPQEQQQDTKDTVDLQEYLAVLQQASEAQKNQQTPQKEAESEQEIQSLLDERSSFTRESAGVPQLAIPKKSSSSSQAQSQEDNTQTNTATPSDTAQATFAVDTRILQLSALESTGGGNDVEGGGGSSLSVFDPSNATQFSSQEVIDKSTDHSGLTIYADNPDFFSSTQGARSVQYSPSLPDGFDVTKVTITVTPTAGALVPSDIQIYAVNLTGSPASSYNEVAATFDGVDTFTINQADIVRDSRGDINLIIVYNQTKTGSTFDLTLSADAVFDPASGYSTPADTEQSDSETKHVTLDTPANVAAALGGAGADDWFLESVPNDTVVSTGNGNDTIYGGQGSDNISTAGGDDTIYADFGDGGANDTIDGGDTAETAGVGDTVNYASRTENITANLGAGGANVSFDVASVATGEQDTLINIENITAGAGDDNLTGSTDINTLRGGDGDDVLIGGDGADLLYGDGNTAVSGGGGDTVDYSAAVGGQDITVNLNGGTAIDEFGNTDQLFGIENAVTGAGDDTFIGDSGDNNFDGGAGTNLVDYSTTATNTITVDLLTLSNATGVDIGTDTFTNIQNITGGTGDDTITGNASANTLRGDGGADTIDGGAGNDVIYGGLGADTLLDGGSGGESGEGDQLRFDDLNAGYITLDLVNTQATHSTTADIDQFQNFESYYLTNQNDQIIGSNAADAIVYGLLGDDTFYASDGADAFDGGGNTAAGDTYDFSAVAGIVQVDLSLNGNEVTQDGFGANVETITNVENIIGGSADDIITGDDADNYLEGRGGDDTLAGGQGDDTLDGGADGASGDWADYSAATAAQSVTVNLAGATTDQYGDTDTLLNIENVIGGSGNDTITGNASDNILQGGAGNGNDYFYASQGDDDYQGGSDGGSFLSLAVDILRYDLFGGTISIDWNTSTISKTLDASTDTYNGIEWIFGTAGVDTVSFTNAATVTLFGNVSIVNTTSYLIYIENYEGSNFNDTLSAPLITNSTINGNGGDDAIYAGISNGYTYTLNGGTQTTKDTLYLTSISQNLTFSLTNATDGTATSTGGETNNFTGFEEFRLGAGADKIYGSAQSDSKVYGGGGNDTFYASAGADDFDGEGGTGDIYDFRAATGTTQRVVIDLGAGQVTEDGFGVTTENIAGIEHVYGTNFNDQITGNTSNNTLNGYNGDDTIYGGDGNDTLNGGTDNDTLYGENGDDTLRGGAGNDTLDGGANTAVGASSGGDIADYSTEASKVTVDLSAGTATGTSIGSDTIVLGTVENVYGSSTGDDITGDNNANRLEGRSGDDTLIGLGGADFLNGGNGVDTADYSDGTQKIDINMQTGVVSNDGFGNAGEQISFIENIIGTDYDDIVRGTSTATAVNDTINNDISTGQGDDTVYGSFGSDQLFGGEGLEDGAGDTLTYSGLAYGSGFTVNFVSEDTASITKSDGADFAQDFENFVFTSNNDTINLNWATLSNLDTDGTTVDGNGGTDTVRLTGNPDLSSQNGDYLANVFSDIDELDLSGATTTGGVDADYNSTNDADDFDLTQANVEAMVGAGGTLTITIDSGFDLHLVGAAGSGTTYNWGATTVEVQVN